MFIESQNDPFAAVFDICFAGDEATMLSHQSEVVPVQAPKSVVQIDQATDVVADLQQ
eukprot:jgi/Botrbrau1/15726/Bobra.4_1s0095.1